MTPIHDDPKVMGMIAACNATNDLFALNAVDVINFNCFLALPIDIPEDIAVGLLSGIKSFLNSIDATITGGHTIQNEAPLLGGSTSAIISKENIINKQGVKEGDKLILTKPLGIQTIMAADRTMKKDVSYLEDFDLEKIQKGIKMAEKIMTTSNRPIAKMIHEYSMFDSVNAMTDVTGFGFSRHLGEMLLNSGCGALIHSLPAILYTPKLEDLFCYGIDEGQSSEIAGAMLLSVRSEDFSDFTDQLTKEKIWHMQVGEITNSISRIKNAPNFSLKEIDEYW